jgi:hypothetical protein
MPDHRGGRPFTRAKRQMFATYGTDCHLCGHPDGLEADHLTPLRDWPDQPIDHTLIRPSHGSNYPCQLCPWPTGKGKPCNQVRGTAQLVFRPTMEW